MTRNISPEEVNHRLRAYDIFVFSASTARIIRSLNLDWRIVLRRAFFTTLRAEKDLLQKQDVTGPESQNQLVCDVDHWAKFVKSRGSQIIINQVNTVCVHMLWNRVFSDYISKQSVLQLKGFFE